MKLHEAIDRLSLIVMRNASMQYRPDGKFLRSKEKVLMKKLKQSWRKQSDWCVDQLGSLSFLADNKKDNAPEDDIDMKSVAFEVDEMMSNLPEKEFVAETIVASMGVAMQKAGDTVIKNLDLGSFGIEFTLDNTDAKKFLGGKLSHELSNFKGNIHRTTTNNISRIILNGAENGDSLKDIAQKIKAQGEEGVFSPARGELIAQTELGRAYKKGAEIPIEQFIDQNPDREMEKRSRDAGDGRVRFEHKEASKQGWIPYAENHKGTGEKAAPFSDFGCRCHEEYRLLPPKEDE